MPQNVNATGDGVSFPLSDPLIAGPPAGTDDGPQEPSQRVGRGWLALYTIAFTAVWMAVLTPIIVTLTLKVQTLVDGAAASTTLSMLLGVGALLALLANPMFGRLSDRTRSRFGMRRPWLVIGAVGGTASIAFVAVAPTVPLALLGWCLAQIFYSALLAAMTAILPDQVPALQRGTVSGFLGIAIPGGTVLGTFIVQFLGGNIVLTFMVPATIALVTTLAFAARLRDRRLVRAERDGAGLVRSLRSFWISPRRNPDFSWAWLSRFLVFMGLATLTTYQAFFLLNRLGVPASRLSVIIFVSTLLQSVAAVTSSIVAGGLSDRTGRRRAFVFGAAVVFAAGVGVVAFAGSIPVFLTGVAIAGAGQGIYLAVDLALVTDVLPNRGTEAAKNLGVFSIANAAPQSIAPAIAPLFLAIGGPGNYLSLFVAAGAFALLGAFAISPVRSVR